MVDYQTLSVVLTGIGMIIALTYYGLQIRNQNKTRQAQLFMNIYDSYSSKEYQKDREQLFVIWEFEDYDDFFRKYGAVVNPEEHARWDMLCAKFEGIAVLIKRRLIDPRLVYDLMYGSIMMFWEKYEPILLGLREQAKDPKVFLDLRARVRMMDWFEYLIEELEKEGKRRGDIPT